MRLNELIAKLEGAPEGDPTLDFWVWWWGEQSRPLAEEPPDDLVEERIQSHRMPNYSGNLDAAATLVPEGYWWRLERRNGGYAASVVPLVGDLDTKEVQGKAPAPALCAAILRCRSSFVHDVMKGRQ